MAKRDGRLQVPIDQDVLNKLHTRAGELGFDSVQAFVRFWAKAEISEPNKNTKGLNDPNAQVLRYIELILAFNPSKPHNAGQALSYLMRQMRRSAFSDVFKGLSNRETSDKIHGT